MLSLILTLSQFLSFCLSACNTARIAKESARNFVCGDFKNLKMHSIFFLVKIVHL